MRKRSIDEQKALFAKDLGKFICRWMSDWELDLCDMLIVMNDAQVSMIQSAQGYIKDNDDDKETTGHAVS